MQNWNHSQFVGESTYLLSQLFEKIPTRIFENEFTGIENTTNAVYRTALLAGVVLPLANSIANGNSAFSYHLHETNTQFHFQNPFRFWENSITIFPQNVSNSTSEIHRNFQLTTGYNASIFLRNSISKNIIQHRNSTVLESATIVATAISQMRPFFNDNTFAGSQVITKSTRFQHQDSLVAENNYKNFQSISTVNFLNPLVWTSLYHLLLGYPIKGKSAQQTPYIRLTKTVTYLPYFDVFLAPYGPEVQLTNVFSNLNNIQTVIHFRLASTEIDNPFSVGVELNDWNLSKSFSASGSIELWNQPRYFAVNTGSIGGQCMAFLSYTPLEVFDEKEIGVCGGIGYKSYGFSNIPNLEESFFVNVGLSLRSLR
jgi:hypothetical protein